MNKKRVGIIFKNHIDRNESFEAFRKERYHVETRFGCYELIYNNYILSFYTDAEDAATSNLFGIILYEDGRYYSFDRSFRINTLINHYYDNMHIFMLAIFNFKEMEIYEDYPLKVIGQVNSIILSIEEKEDE